MIHYSVMPLELVFEDPANQPKYQETKVNGVHMLIEWTGPSKARIVRLLSPNPQDYLNPKFQPGNQIPLKWGD
ncbi:hypothetical protein JIR001_18180 [Polycladomyces abyssicola]|jgi:hypothetical protein|uniref:YlzJ-like protein n=1 Tax=Polycladomyces abyssicola TaxID=1125966 RepID=A0A8D5ZMU1_9BACL|nr:YlzJ-like family protein [Polycladomyces abyssicola]BCU82035.1 hypothetical protein JIR001_18180 [Polycladomyces abyssicola]